MRILFLTHRLPYAPNRGDRIRAYHLLQELSRLHEVHLVSLVHDREELAHVVDLTAPASVSIVPVERIRNLAASVVALAGSRPLTHLLLRGSGMRDVLRERVAAIRPDLVLAYCTGMARYALEPPLDDVPCVLDLVDVDSEKWAAMAQSSGGPKKWIYKREASTLRAFERLAVRRAAATIVVSERERELLEDIVPGSRAVVVENGVEIGRFVADAEPPAEPRVIFCGVFNYRPNEAGAVWFAKDVWPLVTEALPTARLSLVGMNPTRTVRALAKDASIRVTGAVPDVRDHLRQAAVSVAPIWLARGIQNKVLEALASGLPVVVTPPVFDGLPRAARPGCIMAGDARSFAEATLSLLCESPDVRRSRVARADLSQLEWAIQLRPLMEVVATAARSSIGRSGIRSAPLLAGVGDGNQ